ncbi:thiamine biosynthesis protein ThiJ [Massilia sp. Root133]|uniref:DJ-1/PfpI family protein n=1 Tax=Massilia cellulosiltytica TaxID=2683234 RepID=A0A7X3G688_9BURK|nr:MULTISPECIES: DJ-1/PfpI family protein [Telluria group]KQY16903.1 thiamine biosynthesis protein ThiJ [Massilia sp. Root133]KQZ46125.1 thiamine biosynthesis protein ThiJ [Massilia sp. Root1485]MVW64374.1 DJ-1/PfpI family protein [Telluria cellulosilytica]
MNIGFLLFPRVTQLDLTGPAQILSRVPGAQVHLVWKTRDPVPTDVGFTINPTTTFADCPQLDVLCVPGGFGIEDLFGDAHTLAFLRRQGERARYVTSVCNGSLVLGAAGLLDGYRSACHWIWLPFLTRFGAVPVAERIVRDRNRISGGGVTAGIDFGLALAAELAGDDVARMIQLALEYDPQPPLDAGSPQGAGAELVARYREMVAPRLARVEAALAQTAGL